MLGSTHLSKIDGSTHPPTPPGLEHSPFKDNDSKSWQQRCPLVYVLAALSGLYVWRLSATRTKIIWFEKMILS